MKSKSLKTIIATLLPLALLALTSCSTSNPSTNAAPAAGSATDVARGGFILDTVSGTATILSVDQATRTVVLQHPDGSTSIYECGPDVRNFDQIKVGDQVTATSAEELAIFLVKGRTIPAAGTATVVLRSPLGDRPAAKVVQTVAFTAKVLSVDTAGRKVTLQLANGSPKTVHVGPDINLNNVQPGDDVGVRVTQAIAIKVEKPGQNQ